MSEKCREPFPKNKEIRCRKDKHEEGNHIAEGEVIADSEKWNSNTPTRKKVKWEWDGEKVIEEPSQINTIGKPITREQALKIAKQIQGAAERERIEANEEFWEEFYHSSFGSSINCIG